jgi:hypothetical protein
MMNKQQLPRYRVRRFAARIARRSHPVVMPVTSAALHARGFESPRMQLAAAPPFEAWVEERWEDRIPSFLEAVHFADVTGAAQGPLSGLSRTRVHSTAAASAARVSPSAPSQASGAARAASAPNP